MQSLGRYRFIVVGGFPLQYGYRPYYDWRTVWLPSMNPMLKNRKKWQLQVLTKEGNWINIGKDDLLPIAQPQFKDCQA